MHSFRKIDIGGHSYRIHATLDRFVVRAIDDAGRVGTVIDGAINPDGSVRDWSVADHDDISDATVDALVAEVSWFHAAPPDDLRAALREWSNRWSTVGPPGSRPADACVTDACERDLRERIFAAPSKPTPLVVELRRLVRDAERAWDIARDANAPFDVRFARGQLEAYEKALRLAEKQ